MPKKLLNSKSLLNKLTKNSFNLALGIAVFLLVAFGIYQLASNPYLPTPQDKLTQLFNLNKDEILSTGEEKDYTVKDGDFLWKIAEEFFGSGYNAYDIAEANAIDDPDLIYPGQKLIIPRVSPKSPTRGEVASGTISDGTTTTYTVKRGDTLWSISQSLYDTGYSWSKIAAVNNLSNPNLIFEGTELTIPK